MKSAFLYLLLATLALSPQSLKHHTAVEESAAQSLAPATAKAAEPNCSFGPQEMRRTMTVWITAYSSTPDETDNTPFVTASGKDVKSGIVATNFLPFGTRIQIPSLFGDEIFTVEDRMHHRKKNFLDVWMPTKAEALAFGIQCAYITILDEGALHLKDTAYLSLSISYAMSSAPAAFSAPADAL